MPVQRKPRTQPITRVRTGCFTCRRRKKRCGEERPVCSGCKRNKLSCSWPAHNTAPAARTSDQSQEHGAERPLSAESPNASPQSSSSPADSASSASYVAPQSYQEVDPLIDAGQRHEAAIGERPPRRLSASEDTTGQELQRRRKSEFGTLILQGPSLLSGYDAESYQLLNHYLSSTADCMANGSLPINPFLVQIIPLAFSSDLLLQLVLTQSAAHRAFRFQRDADAVSQDQYTKALQRFRGGISKFIGEAEATPLTLTVGALLMCFTEVTPPDVQIFIQSPISF